LIPSGNGFGLVPHHLSWLCVLAIHGDADRLKPCRTGGLASFPLKESCSAFDRATFFAFYCPAFYVLGQMNSNLLRVVWFPTIHLQNLLFTVVGNQLITFRIAI
jgi:hypothetical protein